jgi:adenylate cyclase
MPLAVNMGGEVFPSFDLQVLLQYLGVDPDQVVIKLGQEITIPRPGGATLHIPIDKTASLTINYRARLEDFQSQGYSQMLQGLADKSSNQTTRFTKKLPPLKNNIVIVGVVFNGTDAGVTPLDANSPLVVAHLNTLNNILQNDFIGSVSPWIWMPIYAIFLFGSGNLMLRVGIAPMIPMGFVCMVLVAAVGEALCFGNMQVPVFMPEVGIMLMASVIPTRRFFGEEREKQRVRRAMGAYLSEKVMNKVLAHPDNVKLGGVKQVITIMFCDIRGFTAYCDNRDSQEVLTVLNEYMEEMTQVVFKYDGTVDKYIGDCIMAFWNAPDAQPDHAQRAVCCAMEMRYALANFKTKRAGKDVELFECGIGIHTGEALVGNMGSTLKLNYTAMGSTVNLGARLESLTKKLNERILISEDTRNLLEGEFPLTDRGEAMVPGFANPIRVFAVGADQDIRSALKIGRTIATQQEYTAEEVSKPIWEPAPLPEDADPNP